MEKARELLGTLVKIFVVDEGKEELVERAFVECERIEKTYSRFLQGNELAQLNATVGEWTRVSNELFALIQWGEKVRAESGGAFDLTVKSLLENWGYGGEDGREVKVGGGIELDLEKGMVRAACEIDLGGLGKGYALDRMVDVLSECENFCVNAGGDIYAKGRDPEGAAWKVAFEHPVNLEQAIGIVEVDDFYVACSNPSKRKWKDKHHLVNAIERKPADEMLAVFTQGETGMIVDSYATALFVLGYERAKELVAKVPVEAMLIAPDGKIYRSEGFKGTLFT